MAFLKKMSESDYIKAYAEGGVREREALKKQYARTEVKGQPNSIKLHYWKTDYAGRKERATAVWDRKRGWRS